MDYNHMKGWDKRIQEAVTLKKAKLLSNLLRDLAPDGVAAASAAVEAATSEARRVISATLSDHPDGFSTFILKAIKASICSFNIAASFNTSPVKLLHSIELVVEPSEIHKLVFSSLDRRHQKCCLVAFGASEVHRLHQNRLQFKIWRRRAHGGVGGTPSCQATKCSIERELSFQAVWGGCRWIGEGFGWERKQENELIKQATLDDTQAGTSVMVPSVVEFSTRSPNEESSDEGARAVVCVTQVQFAPYKNTLWWAWARSWFGSRLFSDLQLVHVTGNCFLVFRM
uniref:Uncharacterized protein n=1 Tax=Salix viminalis TaxID=40686 RepID=A0A6N2NC95_SALVM